METKVKHDIKVLNWPEKMYAVKREKISFNKLSKFFEESYQKIYSGLEKNHVKPLSAPCAIYYSFDEAIKQTDVAAAVPISQKIVKDVDYEVLTIPASEVVITTHVGPYDSLMPAYEALEEYLKEHHREKGLMMEEYVVGPSKEKDPEKWKTNVIFTIKK
jgi:effector-binding domain-containing protein